MAIHISYEGAMFFIGIAAVLFPYSDSLSEHGPYDPMGKLYFDKDKLLYSSSFYMPEPVTDTEANPDAASSSNRVSPYSSSPPQPSPFVLSLLQPEKQVKCEQLKSTFAHELIDILSPVIFSQADPFRYFVDKTMKLSLQKVRWAALKLNNNLQNDDLPLCYLPYAKALLSLLRYWPNVDTVGNYIGYIQKLFPQNVADLSFLPTDISLSPQLLQFFSDEILGDPTPPLRIFYKLLGIPKSDTQNLKDQLQKFIDRMLGDPKIESRYKFYSYYANTVVEVLKNESTLDELKRNMTEIQRLTKSGQRFLPAESAV